MESLLQVLTHTFQSHINSNNMKKKFLLVVLPIITLIVSCKKNECHECHYETSQGTKVELGKYCGKDLENIEKNGISNSDGTFEVHCHEH